MSDRDEGLDTAEPPPAPEIRRRVRLYTAQWIGIPAMALIPLLALFGAFGERRTELTAAAAGLDVAIDLPTRVRTAQRTHIEVRVHNLSGDTARDVTVRFDPQYFEDAMDPSFIPERDAPYEATLPALPSGADGSVRVELEFGRMGRSTGAISVSRDGREGTRTRISTFILP
jgi:hypothetical protein